MADPEQTTPGAKFDRLVQIMAILRAPGGCPWDREQSFQTLRKYLLEETYEVLNSIDEADWPNLAEELGDLMLQPVFLAQIAAEDGLFSIGDSIDAIVNKLIRRHPHVFGEARAETADDVKTRWDQIKSEENKEKGKVHAALLEAVPRALPALVEAQEIGSKVAKVGFDWPSAVDVTAKIHEELGELAEASESGNREELEEELGDLLFATVNLARKLNLDAEQALRRANLKFRRRFDHVERGLADKGRPLGEATLEEMEEMWQEAKRNP